MKLFKKVFALSLAVLLCASLLGTHVFAAYDATLLDKGSSVESYTVASGMTYDEYLVRGGMAEDSIKYRASILTFSPQSYIPVVYCSSAGNSGVLKTQYERATNKDGYDVGAVINGAFFSMDSGTNPSGNYGILVGIAISDGKITSAHAGYSDSVVAFGSDGSMNIVNSNIEYKLYFDGKTVPNGIYYINKHSGDNGTWSDRFYYFDTDCGTIADTSSNHPGYEIICEKLDGSDLTVGGTLKGKVLEIRENSSKAEIGTDYNVTSNKFVLFCTAESSYASYVKSLSAGSTIEISADETIEASKTIMRNANSVITNVGWLVKGGVDQTEKVASIGTHSVTLTARWTAFGTKPDGTYVFFTSEGGSTGQKALTLKDVAKLMIAEGCNNVIRMDGGGSSAMYVCNAGSGTAGYQQSSSRKVGDCILAVKPSSMKNAAYTSNLDSAISEASAITNKSKLLTNTLTAAIAVRDRATSVNGDYLKASMSLREVLSAEQEIAALYSSMLSDSKCTDYTSVTAKKLWDACDALEAVKENDNTNAQDLMAACVAVKEAYAARGELGNVVSEGKSYTLSYQPNGSYPDTGTKELTDGKISPSSDPYNAGWVGFSSQGSYTVTIDLGKTYTTLTDFSAYFMQNTDWGIWAPSSVVFAVSAPGSGYTEIGTAIPDHEVDRTASASNVCDVNYTVSLDTPVSARYVKVTINRYMSFVFVTEISVKEKLGHLDNAFINGSDTAPAEGDVSLISEGKSVESYDFDHALTLAYSETAGKYIVRSIWNDGDVNKPVSVPSGSVMLLFNVCDDNYSKLTGLSSYGALTLNGYNKAKGILYGGAYAVYSSIGMQVTPGRFAIDGNYLYLDKESLTASELNAALNDIEALTANGNELTGSAVIGTGASLSSFGTIYSVIVKGDANADGHVGAIDYLIAKRSIIGSYTLNDAQEAALDVVKDSNVDALDYLMIKRHLTGAANLFN